MWVNCYGCAGPDAYRPYNEITELSALPPLLGV